MLSVKQGGIKYYFKSFWYDSAWDWTQVFRAIGEHSNHYVNVRYTTGCLTKVKEVSLLNNVPIAGGEHNDLNLSLEHDSEVKRK